MAKNILITGASSPIGEYFCGRLLQDFPDATFYALYNSRKPAPQSPRLKPVQVNLLNLPAFTATDFPNVDTVIHLASVTPGNNSSGAVDDYYTGNVYSIMALTKHIAAQGALKTIFHLSSSAVYNRSKGAVLDELSEKTHQDHYGLSKLMCEKELETLAAHHGINLLGLRVPVLLVSGVKYNFMSKWKLAISQKQRFKIANPDADFNAVCPGWALYEAFKTQASAKTPTITTTNIFAREKSSLRAILDAADCDLWDEVPASAPAQTIASIYASLPFPAYNALQEVKDFLLEDTARGQVA